MGGHNDTRSPREEIRSSKWVTAAAVPVGTGPAVRLFAATEGGKPAHAKARGKAESHRSVGTARLRPVMHLPATTATPPFPHQRQRIASACQDGVDQSC